LNIIIIFITVFINYIKASVLKIMAQLSIGGKRVYDLSTEDVKKIGGEQGGVKDGRGNVVSYSTMFRNVTSLAHARTIITEINRLLVVKGEDPMTTFLYDHCYHDV
jgi:hypothetical protein